MTDRAWTPAERAWIEAVILREGNLAHLDGEAIERKLNEVRDVEADPFSGLAENTHEGVKR
jgi:hypothetical protein